MKRDLLRLRPNQISIKKFTERAPCHKQQFTRLTKGLWNHLKVHAVPDTYDVRGYRSGHEPTWALELEEWMEIEGKQLQREMSKLKTCQSLYKEREKERLPPENADHSFQFRIQKRYTLLMPTFACLSDVLALLFLILSKLLMFSPTTNAAGDFKNQH